MYHFHTFGALKCTNPIHSISFRFVVGFATLHLEKPTRQTLIGRMHRIPINWYLQDRHTQNQHITSNSPHVSSSYIVSPQYLQLWYINICFKFIVGLWLYANAIQACHDNPREWLYWFLINWCLRHTYSEPTHNLKPKADTMDWCHTFETPKMWFWAYALYQLAMHSTMNFMDSIESSP